MSRWLAQALAETARPDWASSTRGRRDDSSDAPERPESGHEPHVPIVPIGRAQGAIGTIGTIGTDREIEIEERIAMALACRP